MKWTNTAGLVLGLGVMGYFIAQDAGLGPQSFSPPAPVTPNWAAIASWPSVDAPLVEAQPNPNRRVTAIVLDDSGSMGSDMNAAKEAVVEAISAMNPEDRVAVVALNGGIVLPFSSASDAKTAIHEPLRSIIADGTTPLTYAVNRARGLLEEEASVVRGFGTFRVIVTTDGEADDGDALTSAIRDMAAQTPIQLTTIGINVGPSHVLRRSDIGSFVNVANIDALQAALASAVAENTSFEAITDFAEEGS